MMTMILAGAPERRIFRAVGKSQASKKDSPVQSCRALNPGRMTANESQKEKLLFGADSLKQKSVF
jgi:hypothetical protein